ncbi:expressed unknown protein [Seminavis robusta]|uniref:Uncharacterized protein n=1 Tax=Seminavis robusta TaxID=568900 RepID=A0A9N8EKJ9_9STRA|nr:expressed unknown protein [Seminavis robusta]|eukprot:Sro1263_g257181.1  (128) ;mRNA; f:5683-6066
MKQFATEARSELGIGIGEPPILPAGPVWVRVRLYKRPPQNMFVNGNRTRPKGKLLQASQSDSTEYTISMKPDTDNCLKFVLDALTGVGWMDDFQVCKLDAMKCYDSVAPFTGRTLIEFGSLDELVHF